MTFSTSVLQAGALINWATSYSYIYMNMHIQVNCMKYTNSGTSSAHDIPVNTCLKPTTCVVSDTSWLCPLSCSSLCDLRNCCEVPVTSPLTLCDTSPWVAWDAPLWVACDKYSDWTWFPVFSDWTDGLFSVGVSISLRVVRGLYIIIRRIWATIQITAIKIYNKSNDLAQNGQIHGIKY